MLPCLCASLYVHVSSTDTVDAAVEQGVEIDVRVMTSVDVQSPPLRLPLLLLALMLRRGRDAARTCSARPRRGRGRVNAVPTLGPEATPAVPGSSRTG